MHSPALPGSGSSRKSSDTEDTAHGSPSNLDGSRSGSRGGISVHSRSESGLTPASLHLNGAASHQCSRYHPSSLGPHDMGSEAVTTVEEDKMRNFHIGDANRLVCHSPPVLNKEYTTPFVEPIPYLSENCVLLTLSSKERVKKNLTESLTGEQQLSHALSLQLLKSSCNLVKLVA
ncbi:hypothetical protein ACTXT7_002979 [Hymenolepis weldensis]